MAEKNDFSEQMIEVAKHLSSIGAQSTNVLNIVYNNYEELGTNDHYKNSLEELSKTANNTLVQSNALGKDHHRMATLLRSLMQDGKAALDPKIADNIVLDKTRGAIGVIATLLSASNTAQEKFTNTKLQSNLSDNDEKLIKIRGKLQEKVQEMEKRIPPEATIQASEFYTNEMKIEK